MLVVMSRILTTPYMQWKQLIDKLPTRLVKILDLIEESFRRLVNSNYIIEEAYKVFPNYFYRFLKKNL
jgi:hypothetical protein